MGMGNGNKEGASRATFPIPAADLPFKIPQFRFGQRQAVKLPSQHPLDIRFELSTIIRFSQLIIHGFYDG